MLSWLLTAALAAPSLQITVTDVPSGRTATCAFRPGEPCVTWLKATGGPVTLAAAAIPEYPLEHGDAPAVTLRVDRHKGGVAETLATPTVVLAADHTAEFSNERVSVTIAPAP